MLAYAVVYTFVVAAQYYYIVEHRQGVGHPLVKNFSVGRGEYHLIVIALCFECRYTAVHRFYLYHHPGVSAEWIIVDLSVAVGGIVAEIVDFYLAQTFVLRPFKYRAVQRRFEHLRKYRYYIYTHLYLL